MARTPVLDTASLASKTGVQNATYTYAADAGASDAYAITLSPAITAYAAGQQFSFYANTANTGAASLNVNAVGAKTIKKLNDQDLATGDVEAGQIVTVVYNATDDVFEMISSLADVTGSVAAASETVAGKVELATDAETATGTDTARAVTPANLQSKVASDTAKGIVELATIAETTTGSDAARAVTPDGLAGSDFGKKGTSVQVVAGATDVATGDGKAYFVIPDGVGGMNLVGAHAYVITAGVTNTTDIQIHNVTQAADMLTTKITIDSAELSSRTAATAPVIDANNDDVADGDVIRIDVDAISTTAPKGLIIELVFQLP